MEVNKKILYVGNNTSKKTNYGSSILLVSKLLAGEGYQMSITSSKQNIFFRLIDMSISVFKHRNKVDYILIDTFSSLNFYSALITSQISRLFKVKYIPVLRGGNLPHRIEKNKFLSNLIFNNSYINVAPSNYLKTEFDKKNYKTLLIPNILELEKYSFFKREQIEPKLLWVRAFQDVYNPMMAIDTFSLVKKKFPDAKLTMVGPKKDYTFDEVESRIKELELEECIELTGVLPKNVWHEKSKDFDILINTTNFDNTPNSVIEGMAMGLTIVTTNVGGIPYLIDNDIDGVLVEKQNANQMAKEIIRIIKNNENEMSVNARLKVENFGWQKVKYKWFSILK